MSDFLLTLGNNYNGVSLLNQIKAPYGDRSPKGKSFDFPWGSLAILEEHFVYGKNIIVKDDSVFAWVGDLIGDLSDDFIDAISNRVASLQKEADGVSIESDELFAKLNGAFAIIFANATGFSIVTDIFSFVPVYIGRDKCGETVALGTHSDLVAGTSRDSFEVDIVSAAEFLNSGNCTFPYTMHSSVKEMMPGKAHFFNVCENHYTEVKALPYWLPPEEIRESYDKYELAEELERALRDAISDRCDRSKVAVLLSGGLDSRAVMAGVPESVECMGLTFCDEINREAIVARQVAECYGRQWVPLVRDEDFLGNSIVDVIKFIGCEFQWVDSHNLGLADSISKCNMDVLLSGQMFDAYLKTLFTPDIARIQRMRGFLPVKYKKKSFDYFDNLTDFWKEELTDSLTQRVFSRRENYYDQNHDSRRGSVELLNIYPFSQDREASYWAADRRVLPIRLVAMDRRILDFSLKCPVELKLGAEIFLMAAKKLYGTKGASIVCANDGVSPGSGFLTRLVQLAVRKLQNRTRATLEKLGKKSKVQDSWHDYQTYWQESKKISELIEEYGSYLDDFDGTLFKGHGQDLLNYKELNWLTGFRLLQLAIWNGMLKKSRM